MTQKNKYGNLIGVFREVRDAAIASESVHISVDGPHANDHRDQYRGDIDGAMDDFLVTLKRDARQLLRECAKVTPVLSRFHLDFS